MSEPVPGGNAFALTGLTSRGGLSNWVFFFFPDELVMVDVGLAPAVRAGVLAGALGQLGGIGLALLHDEQKFGERFALEKTRACLFFERRAPFLL